MIVTILFFVIWGIGITGSDTSYISTLSDMIANNDVVRTLYVIWIVAYLLFCAFSVYLSTSSDISTVENRNDEVHNKNVHCSMDVKRPCYIVATAFYIPFTYLKLLGLYLLWEYNVSSHQTEHYCWTAIGLICAVGCCWVLFIRRLCCRFYIHLHGFSSFIISINIIFVIMQLVLIILLAVFDNNDRGTYELVLSIFIGLDPLFQIYDIYNDYICKTTNKSELTYKLMKVLVSKLHIISKNKLNSQHLDSSLLYSLTTKPHHPL
jgi:hypothetical protein